MSNKKSTNRVKYTPGVFDTQQESWDPKTTYCNRDKKWDKKRTKRNNFDEWDEWQ